MTSSQDGEAFKRKLKSFFAIILTLIFFTPVPAKAETTEKTDRWTFRYGVAELPHIIEKPKVQPKKVVKPKPVVRYSPNSYIYGQCTYGVASWVKVPTGLGNANQWAYRAKQMGYTVTKTPKVGAVAQTTKGQYGHVSLTLEIKGGKVLIKEMNYKGLGITSSRWANISDFTYIYF